MITSYSEAIQHWKGKPYYSLNVRLLEKFGIKLRKVALNGGFTCPNRDGTQKDAFSAAKAVPVILPQILYRLHRKILHLSPIFNLLQTLTVLSMNWKDAT